MHSLIQPSGCTGRKRSFDRILPIQTQHCEVSGILGTVKGTMSVDIHKQNIHFHCFIIIIIPLLSLDINTALYYIAIYKKNVFYATNSSMPFLVLLYHITSDQNLEETQNKKSLFPTMTERTTSGESTVAGTGAEERLIVTNNRQQRMTNVIVAS
jgi:hypothetical protein